MPVQVLVVEDYHEVVALWNKNVFNKEIVHKQQGRHQFIETFIEESERTRKINFIYKKDNKCVGFINGCYKEGKKVAYMTYILVDKHYRRRGIGNTLFEAFKEAVHKIIGIERVEVSYKNPIKLQWAVPYTPAHIHPHAPGIDMTSEAYIFLKNRGYQDQTTQHAYYKDLKGFEYTDEIKKKIAQLKDEGYLITYYNAAWHKGLHKLFRDLGNPKWQETVEKQLSMESGAPMLVMEKQGVICGFTGPLLVEPNKRGYFAGIGVHSKYRSHGIGKVLFAAMCMGLEAEGAEYMTVFADEHSSVRHIYEEAGFRIVRSWKTLYRKLDAYEEAV